MGDPRGFIDHTRAKQPYRPIEVRLRDWREVMAQWPEAPLRTQASRCMDCGIPFCHQGCPLGNLIPDWNDLVYRGNSREAIDRLHATNNFPEFTGTLCPAPCEGSCVLGINDDPVTIKAVELNIIDYAWEQGWVAPLPPSKETGKSVAVVGSGPAGLAAAQQLRRAGHTVTVFERDDRIGGLMRYGIPEFKMEKRRLDRRLEQLRSEGIVFNTGVHVGKDLPAQDLLAQFDALLLTGGACQARNLPVPGRDLDGVYYAMEFLSLQNRRCEGEKIGDEEFISAQGKHVVIIGGGDTGADCLGTVHRQGAKSVRQFEIMERPPENRAPDNPWPEWPRIFRTSSAHEEGGERWYAVSTKRFIGDQQGKVKSLELTKVEMKKGDKGVYFEEIPGSEQIIDCDLALLAMGFVGPEQSGMIEELGVKLTERGNVWRDRNWQTSVEGVFTAGDMQRGQSLIVWAIAEGRSAARGIDLFLMGDSDLPAPLA